MPNTDQAREYVSNIQSHLQAHNLVYYHGSEVIDAQTDTDEPSIVTRDETVKVNDQNMAETQKGISIYQAVILNGEPVATPADFVASELTKLEESDFFKNIFSRNPFPDRPVI